MTKFYWHIHHDVLVEPVSQPIEERVACIKQEKPKREVDTRLRLMQSVRGNLPQRLIGAWDEYDKARAEWNRAWDEYYLVQGFDAKAECNKAWDKYNKTKAEYHKARAGYDKARAECKEQIEALHKEECPDCPWDGRTIFPTGEGRV